MLSAIVVSVVGFILLYVGWERLRSESQESRGTKIRNAFLIIGGLVAVLLAIWRSRVSERQTQVSNEQTKAALKQAGISNLLFCLQRMPSFCRIRLIRQTPTRTPCSARSRCNRSGP